MDNITSFIVKYSMLVGIFLMPIKNALITIILLTILDMVLGIYASYKEGYKITSRSLRRTISKILVYQFAVILAFVIQNHLLDQPLVSMLTGLIGMIEGKSVFENLYRITKIDFLKLVIDKFQLIYSVHAPTSSKDKNPSYKGKKDHVE